MRVFNTSDGMSSLNEVLRKEAAKYLRESSVADELQKSPGISRDLLAQRFINRACVKASMLGGSTSFMGMAGAVIEAIPITKLHLKLICDVARIYGVAKDIDFEDIEIVMKIYALSLGVRGGVTLAEKASIKMLSRTTARSMAKKAGIRLTKKGILSTVPVFAVIAGGTLNYLTTRQLGGIIKNYFKNTCEEDMGEVWI